MDKVIVLGANGFVGAAVIRALQTSPQFQPVAGVRRPRSTTDDVEQRVCDATNVESVRLALTGIDLAVSCVLGSGKDMVVATRLLCDAAIQKRVRRVVLMSSMSVYGSVEGSVNEASALAGASLGAYGAAKVECERIAQAAVESGAQICVLRPGIVYGPEGDQWIGRIGRLLRAGRIGDLGSVGDGICNLVYKDDVGVAAIAAMSAPGAGGGAFNLSDGGHGTWNDFFTEFGCLIGVPQLKRISPRRMWIEGHVAGPPLQVLKIAQSCVGRRTPTFYDPIPPSLLALWGQRIWLNSEKAGAALGVKWTPRASGLALAADWFLRNELGTRRALPRGLEPRKI